MKKITLLIIAISTSLSSYSQQQMKKVQSLMNPNVECVLSNVVDSFVTNAPDPTSAATIDWTVADSNTEEFMIRINYASTISDGDMNTSVDQIIVKSSGDDFTVLGAGKNAISYGGCAPSTGNKVVLAYVGFTGTYVDGETYTGVFNLYSANGATANTITLNVTVDNSSLAIKNDLSAFNFSYAPNPSTNFINLSAANKIDHVEIMSLLGQTIISRDLDATNETIDISSLQKGIYLMHVTIDGSKGTFKIIKE